MSNPSTPPITEGSPDGPDPFDPFNKPIETDGGAVAVDPTEATFNDHLPRVLQELHGTKSSSTLIESVLSLIQNIDYELTYKLEQQRETIEHHIYSEQSAICSLREITDTHYLYHNPCDCDSIQEEPNEYPDLPTGIEALFETLDWGSPPPGQPTMWQYDGYNPDSHEQSFISYVNGNDQSEYGEHFFINTAAEYTISIASYHPSHHDQITTVCTITTGTNKYTGYPLYRTKFHTQQQAFSFLANLLQHNLSRTIATHDGAIGPYQQVPDIRTLVLDR